MTLSRSLTTSYRRVFISELAVLETQEINIVPKHPNWDLKHGIHSRLDKLKRRTQRAIVDRLREKLSARGDTDD